MSDVPVKKIPMGLRSLPVQASVEKPVRVAAESCGRGSKMERMPHLDELDREWAR